MYKLLIIDNEPVIRKGLKKVIPWGKYGYRICDTAIDGQDGLYKIRKYKPDLVLLDIRMPGLSGIELLEQVRKENLTCDFIVLSAYSSFSYAKELMKLGIDYYLLKPIDETELIEILEQIELNRQKEKQIQDQLQLFEQLNEEKSLGLLFEDKINEVPEETLLHFKEKEFQLAKFSTNIKKANTQWLKKKVEQNSHKMKLITINNNYYLLFINPVEPEVKQILKKILNRFQLYGDEHINIMLTGVVKGPGEISHLRKQVNELATIHFSFSDKKIFTYEHITEENNIIHSEMKEVDQQKALHFIEFGDYHGIHRKGEKLQEYYQKITLPKPKVQEEIIRWILALIRLIQSSYPSIDIVDEHKLVQNIYNQPTLNSVVKYICKELWTISLSIHNIYLSKGNIVDKVVTYVDHYYFKNLSLKFVADLFHYNNAYLGKIFKKQVGKYFSDYLHEVRIKNAKKLLKQEKYKVYEIAELVGYSNSDYFYKNFKEYVGMSPKEYQMKHRRKEG